MTRMVERSASAYECSMGQLSGAGAQGTGGAEGLGIAYR